MVEWYVVFFSSWTRLTYLTQHKSFELSLILEASAFLRSRFARSTELDFLDVSAFRVESSCSADFH